MTRRQIPPIESLSADTQRFFDTLNASSDLAVVLVSASYLDASLGSILSRYFLENSGADKLLDIRGPLGTISARVDAAYALGLVDKKLYQALLAIIEIRNEFAHHHLERNFEVPEVGELCRKLTYLESLVGTEVPSSLREFLNTNRDRFVLHAVLISQRLLLKGLAIKRVPAA